MQTTAQGAPVGDQSNPRKALQTQNLSYALVTPSYAPDFERCRLLCSTRAKFLPEDVSHYVIVDRRDLPLFRQLKIYGIQLIAVEDILPWWIQRIPFSKQGWFSFKGLPIRNWIIQQIIKLSAAQFIDDEIIGYVDSDVAFIRPIDPHQLVFGRNVRLYREPNSIPRDWLSHRRWYESACKLLGIPPTEYPAPNYIGDLVTWRRSNLIKLSDYLTDRHGKPFLEILASCLHFSEYILYGLFVEHILKDDSGHYFDEVYPGLQYFGTKTLSVPEIESYLAGVKSHHVTVMISSKSKTPVNRYEGLLKKLT